MESINNPLIDMIDRAHLLLNEVLNPGDFGIDLTAGRGHDTLWLAQQVTAQHKGNVLAFDIQRQAIDSTSKRLATAGFSVRQLTENQQVAPQGVSLYHGCHSQLPQQLDQAPKAIIANFGYLPGSDHATTTTANSSCAAIDQATQLLATGGRIALVLYTGHSGATQECSAIEQLCSQLDSKQWQVLRLQPMNRNNAPYLLVLEKRCE
ncbi:MAG: class I SAM-dependent methyltransferase [Thermodesulfobacteriota bacterium]|nr:class I SAM-dependent methyltransferase [Thermodesulfobacteriota bacterium]